MFNIQTVQNQLIKLCQNIENKSNSSVSTENIRRFLIKEGIYIHFDNADMQVIEKIIKEIMKGEEIKRNFHEQIVVEQIEKIIATSLKIPPEKRTEHIHYELNKLMNEFKSQIKDWMFFIPIENFLVKRQYTIGDIKYIPFNEAIRNKISSIDRKKLKQNPNYTAKRSREFIDLHLTTLDKSLKNFKGSIATVPANGTNDAAENEAFRKVRLAINLLKLYNLPNDDSHKAYLGISGEIIRGTTRCIYQYTNDLAFVSLVTERTGYMAPFELREDRLNFMRKNGYKQISDILLKREKTDFQNRLINSIFWYGEALNKDIIFSRRDTMNELDSYDNLQYFKIHERLLRLFIALESVLIFNGNEKITKNISKRAAMLLSNQDDEREDIRRFIENMYYKRSEIVHHGQAFIHLEEIDRLSEIVQLTIFRLIKLMNKIPIDSVDNLNKYLKELKLSS